MPYERSGKKNSCYQCPKRVVGCHATCPDHARDNEERKAKNMAKKMFLYPTGSRYFKNPDKISASARYSKKRYR